MTDRLEAALEQGLRDLTLGVPANAQQKLLHYLHLIVKWNNHFNLSGITADFSAHSMRPSSMLIKRVKRVTQSSRGVP